MNAWTGRGLVCFLAAVLLLSSAAYAAPQYKPGKLYFQIQPLPEFTLVVTNPPNNSAATSSPQLVDFEINPPASFAFPGTLLVNRNGQPTQPSQYPIDSPVFSYPFFLQAGTNTFSFTARDSRNATSTATHTLTLQVPTTDTLPPVIDFTSPFENAVLRTSQVMVTGTVSDNAGPITLLTVSTSAGQNFPATASNGSFGFPVTLAFGPNTITVTAKDAANNMGMAVLHLTHADDIPPQFTVSSPADNSVISTATVMVAGTATDNVALAAIQYKLNAGPEVSVPISAGAYSFAVSGLVNGTNALQLWAMDSSGNASPVILLTLTKQDSSPPPPNDTLPPVISLTAPAATTTTPLTLTGTVQDNASKPSNVNVAVSGALSYSFNRAVNQVDGSFGFEVNLAPGSNTLTLTALDAAGNEGRFTATITYTPLDNLPPTLAITSPTGNPTVSTDSMGIQGTATDNVSVLASITPKVNGVAQAPVPVNGGLFSASVNLALGANQVLATAVDAAGNTGQSNQVTITRVQFLPTPPPPDEQAPVISISTPKNLDTVSTPFIPLAGVATDNRGLSVMTYSLNNGPQTSIAFNPVTGAFSANLALAEGLNALVVRAKDAANNTGTAALTVTYAKPDTLAPEITFTTPPNGFRTTNASLPIAGTASDSSGLASLAFRVNGGTLQNLPVSATFSFPLLMPTVGAYAVEVMALDTQGNQGSNTQTYFRDAVSTPPQDIVAPFLEITQPLDRETVSTNKVQVKGNASDDRPGTLAVEARLNNGPPQVYPVTNNAFDFEVFGLAVGTNNLSFMVQDAAGNRTSHSLSVSFAVPDTVAPALTVAEPVNGAIVSQSQVNVAGSVSDDRSTMTTIGLSLNGSASTLYPVTNNAFRVMVMGLTPGPNTLSLAAQDEAGNKTTRLLSITYEAAIVPPVDKDGPILAITQPANNASFTSSFLTVTGTASDASGLSFISYSLDNGVQQVLAPTPAFSFTLSNLSEGQHTLRMTVADSLANTSNATITFYRVSITPPPGEDDQPPVVSISSPLNGETLLTSTATLRGSAIDNVGIASLAYNVNNGPLLSLIPQGALFSSLPISLVPGSNLLSVRARDLAGNTATTSLTVFYVEADNIAPVIVISSPADGLHTQETAIEVKGKVTDNRSLGQGLGGLSLRVNGGSPTPLALDATSHFNTVSNLQLGSNAFQLTATDASGNAAVTEFTVARNPLGPKPPWEPVDDLPPSIFIRSPASNASTESATIEVTGEVRDNVSIRDSAWITVNGGQPLTVAVSNGTFAGVVALLLGSNLITVAALDKAGNTGYQSVAVTRSQPFLPFIDEEKPRILFSSTQTRTSEPSFLISGNASDNVKVEPPLVQVFKGSNQVSSVPLDAAGNFSVGVSLSEGLNSFRFEASDARGNKGSTIYSVTYEPVRTKQPPPVEPPTVTLVAPADKTRTGSHLAQVSIKATNAVSLTLFVNFQPVQSFAVNQAGTFSAAVGLVPGENTITAEALNADQLAASHTIHVTYDQPRSPPPVPLRVQILSPADGLVLAANYENFVAENASHGYGASPPVAGIELSGPVEGAEAGRASIQLFVNDQFLGELPLFGQRFEVPLALTETGSIPIRVQATYLDKTASDTVYIVVEEGSSSGSGSGSGHLASREKSGKPLVLNLQGINLPPSSLPFPNPSLPSFPTPPMTSNRVTTSILSPYPDQRFTSSVINASFFIDDLRTRPSPLYYTIQLNGKQLYAGYGRGSFQKTISGLNPGSNILRLYAKARDGAWAYRWHRIWYNAPTTPTLVINSPANNASFTTATIPIAFTLTSPSPLSYSLAVNNSVQVTGQGNGSMTRNVSLSPGQNTVTVSATVPAQTSLPSSGNPNAIGPGGTIPAYTLTASITVTYSYTPPVASLTSPHFSLQQISIADSTDKVLRIMGPLISSPTNPGTTYTQLPTPGGTSILQPGIKICPQNSAFSGRTRVRLQLNTIANPLNVSAYCNYDNACNYGEGCGCSDCPAVQGCSNPQAYWTNTFLIDAKPLGISCPTTVNAGALGQLTLPGNSCFSGLPMPVIMNMFMKLPAAITLLFRSPNSFNYLDSHFVLPFTGAAWILVPAGSVPPYSRQPSDNPGQSSPWTVPPNAFDPPGSTPLALGSTPSYESFLDTSQAKQGDLLLLLVQLNQSAGNFLARPFLVGTCNNGLDDNNLNGADDFTECSGNNFVNLLTSFLFPGGMPPVIGLPPTASVQSYLIPLEVDCTQQTMEVPLACQEKLNQPTNSNCPPGTTRCPTGLCATACPGANQGSLPCNENKLCEVNENCSCSDCFGQPSSCIQGAKCAEPAKNQLAREGRENILVAYSQPMPGNSGLNSVTAFYVEPSVPLQAAPLLHCAGAVDWALLEENGLPALYCKLQGNACLRATPWEGLTKASCPSQDAFAQKGNVLGTRGLRHYSVKFIDYCLTRPAVPQCMLQLVDASNRALPLFNGQLTSMPTVLATETQSSGNAYVLAELKLQQSSLSLYSVVRGNLQSRLLPLITPCPVGSSSPCVNGLAMLSGELPAANVCECSQGTVLCEGCNQCAAPGRCPRQSCPPGSGLCVDGSCSPYCQSLPCPEGLTRCLDGTCQPPSQCQGQACTPPSQTCNDNSCRLDCGPGPCQVNCVPCLPGLNRCANGSCQVDCGPGGGEPCLPPKKVCEDNVCRFDCGSGRGPGPCQVNCPSCPPGRIPCLDGSCREFCGPCQLGQALCADDVCRPDCGTGACPPGQQLCGDNSCQTDCGPGPCTGIFVECLPCPNGLQRCEDNTCQADCGSGPPCLPPKTRCSNGSCSWLCTPDPGPGPCKSNCLPCPGGQTRCADNTCRTFCGPCPVGQTLCSDSACRLDCGPPICQVNCPICPVGKTACVDGSCRDYCGPPLQCPVGQSLCSDNTCKVDCGSVGGGCPVGTTRCLDNTCKVDCGSGNFLPCNRDGACETTEACNCSDCASQKDGCVDASACRYFGETVGSTGTGLCGCPTGTVLAPDGTCKAGGCLPGTNLCADNSCRPDCSLVPGPVDMKINLTFENFSKPLQQGSVEFQANGVPVPEGAKLRVSGGNKNVQVQYSDRFVNGQFYSLKSSVRDSASGRFSLDFRFKAAQDLKTVDDLVFEVEQPQANFAAKKIGLKVKTPASMRIYGKDKPGKPGYLLPSPNKLSFSLGRLKVAERIKFEFSEALGSNLAAGIERLPNGLKVVFLEGEQGFGEFILDLAVSEPPSPRLCDNDRVCEASEDCSCRDCDGKQGICASTVACNVRLSACACPKGTVLDARGKCSPVAACPAGTNRCTDGSCKPSMLCGQPASCEADGVCGLDESCVCGDCEGLISNCERGARCSLESGNCECPEETVQCADGTCRDKASDCSEPEELLIALKQSLTIGERQVVEVRNQLGNTIRAATVIAEAPDGEKLEALTDELGKVEFTVKVPGVYAVKVVKEQLSAEKSFSALDLFGSILNSISSSLEPTIEAIEQVGPFAVVLLLVCAMAAAYLVYSQARAFFPPGPKSTTHLKREKLVQAFLALLAFALPLWLGLSSRLGLGVIAALAEIGVSFLAAYTLKRYHESGKTIRV